MINIETKKAYSKSNLETLLCEAIKNQYHSIEWGTFLQFKKMGRSVKKGQHGVRLVKMDKEFNLITGNQEKVFKGSFFVFNKEQTEERKGA